LGFDSQIKLENGRVLIALPFFVSISVYVDMSDEDIYAYFEELEYSDSSR
jgi:hypothetical protein